MKLSASLVLISLAVILFGCVNPSSQANLVICNERRGISLKDDNGNELKKICDVKTQKNYEQAEDHCRNNGMALLVIENEAVFKAFSKFLLKNIPGSTNWGATQGVWINGKRYFSNGWYTYAPHGKELNSKALKWSNKGAGSGDCLAVKRQSAFHVEGCSCTKPYRYVCQFDVAPFVTATATTITTTQKPTKKPTPKCPEFDENSCNDFKQDRDNYKQQSTTCKNDLLSKNGDFDSCKDDLETCTSTQELKDSEINKMATRVAECEIKVEDLELKLSKYE
jgi:hypothetical protein